MTPSSDDSNNGIEICQGNPPREMKHTHNTLVESMGLLGTNETCAIHSKERPNNGACVTADRRCDAGSLEIDESCDNSEAQNRLGEKRFCTVVKIAFTASAVLFVALFRHFAVSERDRQSLRQKWRSRGHIHGSTWGKNYKKNGKYLNHKHSGSTKKSYPDFPASTLLGIRASNTSLNGIDYMPLMRDGSLTPYDPLSDFQYEQRGRIRTVTYWEEVVSAIEQSQSPRHSSKINGTKNLWSNLSTWGPCYPRPLPMKNEASNERKEIRNGKLHPNSLDKNSQLLHNWTSIVESNIGHLDNKDNIIYPSSIRAHRFQHGKEESLDGLCRPGFLIIGQGKCGTSSLYHYITGHPRVMPASEKQIHYFLYHTHNSLDWYYSHFPTLESFLGQGALMTGEASPGYMPYPSVIETLIKRMSPSDVGQVGGIDAWRKNIISLPKIVAIVRNPIDRAISSYNYNYVTPALQKMKTGRAKTTGGTHIPGGKSETYYRKHHLFTFEELASAELIALRECLRPGGKGEFLTFNSYGKQPNMFFYDSFQRRLGNYSSKHVLNDTISGAQNSLLPLVHLDGFCYPKTKSKAVPREQWKELAKDSPSKFLLLQNIQLTQSLIGRGLYTLPLEWWYEAFSVSNPLTGDERIHVVCTEELSETPVSVMDGLAKFLGLPRFDFANVTNVGRYNVGDHRGYDTVTPWQNSDEESNGEYTENLSPWFLNDGQDLTSISDELMTDLIEFYFPFNERLFELIGKRCPW